MTRTEVLSVIQCNCDPTAEWGHYIDTPIAPAVSVNPYIEVRGWTLPRSDACRGVLVFEGDRVLRTISVEEFREDLSRSFPDVSDSGRAGFCGLIPTSSLPKEFELRLYSLLSEGRRLPIGSIHGRRLSPEDESTVLRPIIVNSLGRTGTTWFMRIISCHPKIAVRQQYPFETRAATYWAHLSDVLTRPADDARSSHPDTFASDPFHAGHHPAYHPNALPPSIKFWFESSYADDARRFCRNSTELFYRQVACGQRQADASHFCEKVSPGRVPRLFRELFGSVKEIVLVRDPRDILCSILAFNQRRGFHGFGRETVATDFEFVRYLTSSLADLLSDWRMRSREACLVHYEDLISEPHKTLSTLLGYLDVPSDDCTVRQILRSASTHSTELEAHRTTTDVRDSIERWRRDLSPELIAECEQAFREPLEEFGYTR